MSDPLICPICHYANPASQRFCENCGHPLPRLPAPEAPKVEEAPKEKEPSLPAKATSEIPSSAVRNTPKETASEELKKDEIPANPSPIPANGAICPVCGFHNPPGKNRCEQCGERLVVSSSVEEHPAPSLPKESETDATPKSKAVLRDERYEKICPYCGESNPSDALTCLACHVPLSDVEATLKPVKLTALALSFENPSGSFLLVFSEAKQHFGRNYAPNATIANNRKISRDHFLYYLLEGVAYLEDLGSTNGTKINGIALQKGVPTPLKEGDRVAIADALYNIHPC
jgi:ribosomal protein L40E